MKERKKDVRGEGQSSTNKLPRRVSIRLRISLGGFKIYINSNFPIEKNSKRIEGVEGVDANKVYIYPRTLTFFSPFSFFILFYTST